MGNKQAVSAVHVLSANICPPSVRSTRGPGSEVRQDPSYCLPRCSQRLCRVHRLCRPPARLPSRDTVPVSPDIDLESRHGRCLLRNIGLRVELSNAQINAPEKCRSSASKPRVIDFSTIPAFICPDGDSHIHSYATRLHWTHPQCT